MSARSWVIALLALALLGAIHWARHRPVTHGPGVLAAAEPLQRPPRDTAPVQHGDYTLTPLADFEVEARVLARADYHLDELSALVPTDLALGWGRMSDSAVLAQLRISQSARFYHYGWRGTPPIPAVEIGRSSANMHFIPADAGVAGQLARIREGQVVRLGGQLVDVARADGWHARSSLTRADSGAGACEIVLLREVWVER